MCSGECEIQNSCRTSLDVDAGNDRYPPGLSHLEPGCPDSASSPAVHDSASPRQRRITAYATAATSCVQWRGRLAGTAVETQARGIGATLCRAAGKMS
jgi:hypothetical protein